MADKPLNMDEIATFLTQGRGSGPRTDPTEPRVSNNWFKLNHIIREEGCDNPDCKDPRVEGDRGTNIVAFIKGKHMCRFCFLGGWLSASSVTTDTSSISNQ